jgi:hypothetical protein
LDLDTIGELQDGKFAEQFRNFMTLIYEDLKNRKTDKRARTLTMTIAITPVAEMRETICDETVMELVGSRAKVFLHVAIPKRETNVVDLGVDHNGKFYFNRRCQTNLNQTTMQFDAENSAEAEAAE